MIEISIPGRDPLQIEHLVLDYNGTIAADGLLLPGAAERIRALSNQVCVHILTADTYGSVRAQCQDLGARIHTFPRAGAGACKEKIVKSLKGQAVCVGNGFNDRAMFACSALSIAVLDAEGCWGRLVSCADVLVRRSEDALDLLLKPERLRATLRS